MTTPATADATAILLDCLITSRRVGPPLVELLTLYLLRSFGHRRKVGQSIPDTADRGESQSARCRNSLELAHGTILQILIVQLKQLPCPIYITGLETLLEPTNSF